MTIAYHSVKDKYLNYGNAPPLATPEQRRRVMVATLLAVLALLTIGATINVSSMLPARIAQAMPTPTVARASAAIAVDLSGADELDEYEARFGRGDPTRDFGKRRFYIIGEGARPGLESGNGSIVMLDLPGAWDSWSTPTQREWELQQYRDVYGPIEQWR